MELSLSDILSLTGGKLLQETTPEIAISGVATLSEACPDEVAFLGNEKYFQDYLNSRAGVILVPPALPKYPEGRIYVEVENPSLAFNALVDAFMKVAKRFEPGVHPTAIIDPSARLNPDKVHIGAGTVVEAGAVIGDGCDIGAGCVIGAGVSIGEHCKFHAKVVIRERCIIGHHVVIQPGAVIGGDGFGFLLNPQTGTYDTIDQVGIVVIGNHVDIGANTTIDRARFGRTVIGDGSKIDNLVQIGHNCTLGKNVVICAQSGAAGSTHLSDYVVCAAQVGLAGHLTVGPQAQIGARSGVMNDLEGGKKYWGAPACDAKDAARQFAAIRKLPDAFKELRELQQKAAEIKALIDSAMATQG